MDWLERFVIANEELIKDDDDKMLAGKKTRRVRPNATFIATTRVMAQMRNVFRKVTIQPVSAGEQYTMMTYYSELSAYDR
jgi:hypothetical protein